MKQYEFWFVVGSQFLYGPEVLEIVETRAREMAAELSRVLPYPLVYKVTAKTNEEITDVVKEANFHDECAGIVTWLKVRNTPLAPTCWRSARLWRRTSPGSRPIIWASA